MTTEEIEALLDGAEESDRLEFKGAMAWDKKSLGLVKDILAMANIQDGGRIVIGVKDGSFQREGVSEEQISTFKIDDMRDQVAPYAEPRVVFKVDTATDKGGLRYVIIDVLPFDDQPVICKKDATDMQAGCIYFRSQAQKPQSARVANATDMREIIDRAVVRAMHRQLKIGFTVLPETSYNYDEELGGL